MTLLWLTYFIMLFLNYNNTNLTNNMKKKARKNKKRTGLLLTTQQFSFHNGSTTLIRNIFHLGYNDLEH